MTGVTEPTLDALYTRVEGRIEALHASSLSYIKELIDKNQELQREVDRLKKEIEAHQEPVHPSPKPVHPSSKHDEL